MKNSPTYAIASVDHALQLATILQVEGPLTVTAAAARLGVAKSTAHRLLSMLVYRDFAGRDDDRRYVAGPILSLGIHTQSRVDALRSAAMPHLLTLVERTGESANLTVLAGDRVRFVGSAETDKALRVGNREGTVFAAHLTSGGKVMLAERDDSTIMEMYSAAHWEGRAEEQPDTPGLLHELAAIRRSGIAINVDQTEKGVTALGIALHVDDGPAQAAVSISLPSLRFSDAVLPSFVVALTAAAKGIEASMGSET